MMRFLFSLVIFWVTVSSSFAEDYFPKLTGRVVDEANIISAHREATLTAVLKTEEEASSNQLVVVTVKSLNGYEIADYANRLARHWKIGGKEHNNGVLFLIAPNDRKLRIEVGYGLEGDLTDAVSFDIIQHRVLPQFKQGKFEDGIMLGVENIIQAIHGAYEAAPETDEKTPVALIIFIVIFIIVMIVMDKSNGGGGRGIGHMNRRSDYGYGSGYSSGGSFGGGGFGGGGFSGGGGSFGGGGASGGW